MGKRITKGTKNLFLSYDIVNRWRNSTNNL